MIEADIVVVDTGCEYQHKFLQRTDIQGITLIGDGKNFKIINGFSDENGHGTAVCGILVLHKAKNIFVIKINVDENVDTDFLLYSALYYIYNNIRTKIVNISMGCKCLRIEDMKNICDMLYKRGTVIVSAFDNDGFISYPAMFNNVIGVSSSDSCQHINDFVAVENSYIDFYAKGNSQKLLWLNNGYVFSGGNSFACAHLAGYINYVLNETKSVKFEDLFQYLREKAQYVFSCNNESDYTSYNVYKSLNIQKAVIFPIIKETHPLISFYDLLEFQITHVYDVKERGMVGKRTEEFIYLDDCSLNITIEDINNINFDDFDTIILGHSIDILNLVGKTQYIEYLIELCIKKNKKIFSFDPIDLDKFDLASYNGKIFFPYINKYKNQSTYTGSLFKNSIPHVGVYGTSSKQGKYTLQLILRRLLKNEGYLVGQIGTEPSSYLFDMDCCYNFGYNSTVQIYRYDSITYLNQAIYEISMKNPDIIISGCQAGIGYFGEGNLFNYPFPQFEFLLGTYPDSVILCINYDDDLNDIKRSIDFLESTIQCKVIAMVVFPAKRIMKNDYYSIKEKINNIEMNSVKLFFKEKLNISAYILGDECDMKMLLESIISNY